MQLNASCHVSEKVHSVHEEGRRTRLGRYGLGNVMIRTCGYNLAYSKIESAEGIN